MFAQVIQGGTSNPQALDAAVNQWVQDLAPGATGWLGSTSGVTEDGRAIAVVRFESEEDAGRNSNRPEQDKWWSETSKLFEGEATFQAALTSPLMFRGSRPGRLRTDHAGPQQ